MLKWKAEILVILNLPSSCVYYSALSDLSCTPESCLFELLFQTPFRLDSYLGSASCCHWQEARGCKERIVDALLPHSLPNSVQNSGSSDFPLGLYLPLGRRYLPHISNSHWAAKTSLLLCLFGPKSDSGFPLFLLLGPRQSFVQIPAAHLQLCLQ